jgi:hypothetical protein
MMVTVKPGLSTDRHAHDGICAEPRLVLGSVEVDQRLVQRCQILEVPAAQPFSDLAVDTGHGPKHTLAAET